MYKAFVFQARGTEFGSPGPQKSQVDVTALWKSRVHGACVVEVRNPKSKLVSQMRCDLISVCKV